MKILIFTIIAAAAGATVRIIFLEIINRLRSTHIDLIKAIGTLYRGSFEHVLLKGISAHYIGGLIDTLFYLILLSVFNPGSIVISALYGGLIGLYNGYAVGFSLTALVSEHHPLEEFRKYGHEAVIYYWAGQVLFGITVGAVLGATHMFTL